MKPHTLKSLLIVAATLAAASAHATLRANYVLVTNTSEQSVKRGDAVNSPASSLSFTDSLSASGAAGASLGNAVPAQTVYGELRGSARQPAA